MKKIKFWLNNARTVSLPQSLMPAIVAVFLAREQEDFSIILAILAVFGICMVHLGMNLFDDYFDYKKKESGYRDTLAREGIRARTIKCPYLIDGSATMKELFLAACTFGVLAAIPGFIILLSRGWPIILIGAITVIVGLSYSGGPLSLSFHGLGELTIGVIFGPLLMIGAYYAAGGEFSASVIAPAISFGLLVINIVYTHSVLDYEADLRANKSTLAGVIKNKKGMMAAFAIFDFGPFVVFGVAMAGGYLSYIYLLTFFMIPWAIVLFRSVCMHQKHPEEFQKPKGWFGSMPHWDYMVKEGIDWFMFRWLLARNITTMFALLCVIASILEQVLR